MQILIFLRPCSTWTTGHIWNQFEAQYLEGKGQQFKWENCFGVKNRVSYKNHFYSKAHYKRKQVKSNTPPTTTSYFSS